MSLFQNNAKAMQQLPNGVSIARFSTYEEAQAAVSKISESDADVAGVAIIGSDLRLVERVVSKLSYPRVAMMGASRGLMFGVFIGLVYMLIDPSAIQNVILFPILGVAFGILMGVITHSMTRSKRDFRSVQQVLATSYEVVAPHEIAGRAMHIVGQRQAPAPSGQPVIPQQEQPPVRDDSAGERDQ